MSLFRCVFIGFANTIDIIGSKVRLRQMDNFILKSHLRRYFRLIICDVFCSAAIISGPFREQVKCHVGAGRHL